MFKFLKSLTKAQQDILTVILILLDLFIIVFWINFWVFLQKPVLPPIVEEKLAALTGPFQPGEVGEITEEEAKEKGILPLPLQIFNTSGVISEVKNDRLIIKGLGSNFVDKQPRSLTVIFTDLTETIEPGQKVKYQGLTGLKYLKPGMEIGIQGSENIRGKTEFTASIINIF